MNAEKEVILNVSEPKKFTNAIKKSVNEAVEKGYDIGLQFGGPEEFPTHEYFNNDIEFKKAAVYSADYWTRMHITVAGKSDKENLRELNEILDGIKDQIDNHAEPRFH
jgi:ribulose bisphosphate carboxylase small subunit